MRQEMVRESHNVGDTERMVSAIGGGSLVIYGLTRRSPGGLGLAALGGLLVARGVTGRCGLYEALGKSSTAPAGEHASLGSGQGIKVTSAITIDRPKDELYASWRRFENHTYFMPGVRNVSLLPDGRSHWIAESPSGTWVEWDAEVVNEVPYELIGWRSLEGAATPHAGSVHFTQASSGRGTTVRVVLRYDPPGGKVGAALAKLTGREPEQVLEEGLRRFKRLMETGQIDRTGPAALRERQEPSR